MPNKYHRVTDTNSRSVIHLGALQIMRITSMILLKFNPNHFVHDEKYFYKLYTVIRGAQSIMCCYALARFGT